MAEQISTANADLFLLEADLDEDFSKITSRGPSRKRSKSCVVEYKYGSSGRMYHTRGNRQPRRTAGNMEINSKRTSGSSEDNRLQGDGTRIWLLSLCSQSTGFVLSRSGGISGGRRLAGF